MALATIGFARSFARPKKTANANTAFTSLAKPVGGKKTKWTLALYTDTGTSHNLTFMTPLAFTTVSAVAAGAATSLLLTRDPGNYSANATADGHETPSVSNNLIAANDYIVVEQPDGNYLVTTPSAAATAGSGVVTLTVSALPTGGIAAGSRVWFMGIYSDTNPRTGEAHVLIPGATGSTTTTYGDGTYSLAETPGMGEPILFYSDNATGAGILVRGYGFYGP